MKENVFKFLFSAVLMFSIQLAYAQPGDGFDCDCDDEYAPVCVEDDGFNFTMPNACIAECLGFTDFTEGECENEWEDDWGDDDDWDDDWGFDCDCDEDVWEPVCVEDDGYTFTMPSACIAECLGFTDFTEGECENEWDDEWDDDWVFDCDCDEEVWEPVCVEHEGCIFTMSSACMAECFGYTDYTEGECDNEWDDEWEDDWNDEFDCDCDEDVWEPVCIEDDGYTFTMPSACIAECLGFTDYTEGECENDWDDEWDDEWDFDCDCDENVWEPVCVEDDGYTFTLQSACMAECFGYTDYTEGECENEWDDEWEDDWGFDCDCDPEEFAPVCVEDDGYTFTMPSACMAECFGYTNFTEGECENEWEDDWSDDDWNDEFDCDCDPEEFDPVCVMIEEDFIVTFPSACLADCFGLEIVGEGDCEEGEDDEGGNVQQYQISSSDNTSVGVISDLSSFPNPAADLLNLSFKMDSDALVDVDVMSISGQKIESIQMSGSEGQQRMQLNLQDYESGVYFVTLSSDNQQAVTLRFVKL